MTDVDLNAIKAGDYELTALRWDEITSKPGQPLDFVRHRRGDKVTLSVEEARRLVLAGAVVKPGFVPETPGTGPSVAPGVDTSTEVDAEPPVYDPGAAGETIDKVLAYVGDDSALAAAVLELEQGGQNRSTLVDKLQALANPAS